MLKIEPSIAVMSVGALLLGLTVKANGQEGQAMSPTPGHELLAHCVGTWDATIKSWTQGPDSEPLISHGTEVVRLMPGGLWAVEEFEGKFGEAPFHGHGQSGYDPLKKKYVGTWVDSMSPSIMMIEGDYDPISKTMTSYGKGTEPRSGKPFEAKMTTVHKDKDSRVFTMFMKSDETKGEFVKMMEISYTRQAK